MEKIAWVMLGAVVLAAAVRADRSARSRRVGEVAFAAPFIGAGAPVNTYYLVTGYAFEDFADPAHFGVSGTHGLPSWSRTPPCGSGY